MEEEPTVVIFDKDQVVIRGSVTLDDFTYWINTPHYNEKYTFDKSHGFEKISKRLVILILEHVQNRYLKEECSSEYAATMFKGLDLMCKYDYDKIYNELYPSKPKSARNV